MSDERYVDGPPAGPDAWREVWLGDQRYRTRPSRYEWLLRPLRRLFRRAAEPDAERQQNFHVVLLDLVADAPELGRDVFVGASLRAGGGVALRHVHG